MRNKYIKRTNRTPATENLADKIPAQRVHVDQLLLRRGIEVKFGSDIEFALAPSDAITAEDQVRIASEESLLRQRVTEHVAQGPYKDRLAEAQAFKLEGLVMYDMLYLDPRTKDFLEPLFGMGSDDHSFYDGKVMEAKIKPSDSETYLNNLDTFITVMHEKAQQYGLEPQIVPNLHLNMSFWRDGQNLADPHHPEYNATTARILTGLQKAIAAGNVFIGQCDPNMSHTARLGVSRGEDDLRLAGEGDTGRVELRMRHTLADLDLAIIIEAILKPGIAYGLEHEAETQPARRALFERRDGEFQLTTHALQGCLVVPAEEEGMYKLEPSKGYLTAMGFGRRQGEKMSEDLGLKYEIPYTIEKLTLPYYDDKREAIMRDCVSDDQLIELFENIRLRRTESGMQIIWPTEKTFPLGTYPLNLPIERLQAKIHCNDIVPALTGDIYQAGGTFGIRDNEIFADTIQPEFKQSLVDSIQKHHEDIMDRRFGSDVWRKWV